MNAIANCLVTKELKTTSLIVADKFEKAHKHVLEAIRKLHLPDEYRRSNFRPIIINDLRGECTSHVEMTRDGFVLLVMGFTGKKAMTWKIQFLEAFKAMEAALKSDEFAARASRPPHNCENAVLDPFQEHGPDVVYGWLAIIRETRLTYGRKSAQVVWPLSGLPVPLFEKGEPVPADSAHLHDFIERCCVVTGQHETIAFPADLYKAYQLWCQHEKRFCLGERSFYRRFAEMAGIAFETPDGALTTFDKTKSGTTIYRGIEISGNYVCDDMAMFR